MNRDLERMLDGVLATSSRAYIGTTAYPHKRLLQHRAETGRDRLTLVWWGQDAHQVRALEREAIRMYRHRLKLENVSDEPGGFIANARVTWLYVSWTRMQIGPNPAAQLVTRLPVYETPPLGMPLPHHLWTLLSVEEAAAVVAGGER